MMKYLYLFILLSVFTFNSFALKPKEVREELDSFFDPKVDYHKTIGRITDRDASGHVFKIKGEDPNLKFFRSGDRVEFSMPGVQLDTKCSAVVRSTEYDYVILYVNDISECWPHTGKVRIGTILNIDSIDLAKRVKEASIYRVILLKRREDYVEQLKSLNNFIWAYNEKRIQVAAEFDKKILEIQKQKAKALSFLSLKKKNSMGLQSELSYRLDQLERELDFYRVEKRELYTDRWFLDQDTGVPVKNRPQDFKKNDSEYYRKTEL